jgi:hypothetical protein
MIADARKGVVKLIEVYKNTDRMGPIVCPRRILVILIPRAVPINSEGILSESKATLEVHVMLQKLIVAV